MSNQNFATEQLLELLIQLKKTTPVAARAILNGQPQIAYALMTLMVKLNAVNFEVFQKTLADYGKTAGATTAPPAVATPTPSMPPSVQPTPVPAIPPHMYPHGQHYRTATPPTQAPYPYSNGQSLPPQSNSPKPYGQPQGPPAPPNAGYGYSQPQPQYGYGYNAPAPGPVAPPRIPDAIAAMPEDQKALIMRVLAMTPEQLNALPPSDRQTYIQLRNTLGVV
ncbi:hypothetical protein H0H92_008122 [Tricholoma furcatifolium]|nr:hypothetical protein H0H92_008122 [Tricholoma furcatifolium]